MKYNPPIEERETDELIRIANYPDDWSQSAIAQAKEELVRRAVSAEHQSKKVDQWNYFENKRKRLEKARKANEGYNFLDILFLDWDFIIEFLFDWELKSKGYLKKYKQRKDIILLGLLALIIIWLINRFIK